MNSIPMSSRLLCTLALCVGAFIFAQAQLPAERYTEAEIKTLNTFLEGQQQRMMGNTAKAIPLFEKVLKETPDNDAAQYELAQIYLQTQQYAKGLSLAQRAAANAPTNPWYQILVADLHEALNEDDKAAAVYAGLVKSQPLSEQFYYQWAHYLVRAGDVDGALKVYETLEKQVGINEALSKRKHTLYVGEGDYKKAAREYDRLIERFPFRTEYRVWLAQFYERTGDDAAARNAYAELLKVDPTHPEATLALVQRNAEAGSGGAVVKMQAVFADPDVALDLKLAQLDPYLRKTANGRDRALADEAMPLVETLIGTHPEASAPYAAAGDLYYFTDRPAEAREQYEQALKFDQSSYPLWKNYLTTLERLSDATALVDQSERALDYFPNQGHIFYLNGVGYYRQQAYKDALSSLQQAQLMASTKDGLLYAVQAQLGLTYLGMGNLERAQATLDKSLQQGGDKHAATLEAYGDLLMQQGKNSDARTWYERAIEEGGDQARIGGKLDVK